MSIHSSVANCILAAGFCAALACGPAYGEDAKVSAAKSPPATVVFICKYGSSKSMWAQDRFNKLAEQRGLNVRAIGRAANPGEFVHKHVSEVVARQMELEGSHVADYKIDILTPEEAAAAEAVVHISLQGESDPDSSIAAAAHVSPQRWEGVPSMLRLPDGSIDPSGKQFNTARALLLTRVDALFEEIASKAARHATK